MSGIISTAVWITHKGKKRRRNEDRLYVAGTVVAEEAMSGVAKPFEVAGEALFLLADGMGGHSGGDRASLLTVQRVAKSLMPPYSLSGIEAAIVDANRAIFLESLENPALAGMGTTIVGIAIQQDTMRAFNVGDSRAYLVRRGVCDRITIDDVPDALDSSIRRGGRGITQALGGISRRKKISPHVKSICMEPNDRVLLCSDGLTDMVSEELLERHLTQTPSIHDACGALFEAAMDEGGEDNISIILISLRHAAT